MKTIQPLLAVTVLLTAACSKSDNNNGTPPPNSKTPLYIASYVTLSQFGDSVFYDYNSDKTLKRQALYIQKDTSRAFIYYPQYGNSQLEGIYEARNTKDPQGLPWVTFNRNPGGQIIKATVAKSTNYRAFTYDNTGKIAEMHIYGPADTDSSVISFTWEGKNLAKVIETGTNFGSAYNNTVTYTYHDKWNPHSYMGLPAYLSSNGYSQLSDNNVKTETWVTNGKAYVTAYEYVYNNRNYPTHIKSTTTGYNYPILEEFDITYWPE